LSSLLIVDATSQEDYKKLDAMFKAALFNIIADNIVDPYMTFRLSDVGTDHVMEQYPITTR
jgi:hypothetical protein